MKQLKYFLILNRFPNHLMILLKYFLKEFFKHSKQIQFDKNDLYNQLNMGVIELIYHL